MLLFYKSLIVYFAILCKWTNKKLSDWLAHRVSLLDYWEFTELLFINGKKFQKEEFIN